RRIAVHGDVPGAELTRQHAGEVVHAGLGGGVGGAAHDGRDGGIGGGIDDAPRALPLHHGRDGPAHEEGALEVHVLVEVPDLLGQGLDGTARGDAGIVDQDVDPAMGRHHRAHHLRDARGVADVAAMMLAAPALGLPLRGERVEVLRADIGDRGDGALGGQRGGDLAADAAARPRDEGDLTLEVDEHPASSLNREWYASARGHHPMLVASGLSGHRVDAGRRHGVGSSPMPTLVMLPPQSEKTREWGARLAAALPALEVVVAEDEAAAAQALPKAEAAFGTLTPTLLAQATRLR